MSFWDQKNCWLAAASRRPPPRDPFDSMEHGGSMQTVPGAMQTTQHLQKCEATTKERSVAIASDGDASTSKVRRKEVSGMNEGEVRKSAMAVTEWLAGTAGVRLGRVEVVHPHH